MHRLRRVFKTSLFCWLGLHTMVERGAAVLTPHNHQWSEALSLLDNPKTHKLAQKHFLILAHQGFLPAMHALADGLLIGDGCSILWYREAADNGYIPAMVCLGIILSNGEAGSINYPLGYYYLWQGAYSSVLNIESAPFIEIAKKKAGEVFAVMSPKQREQAVFMVQRKDVVRHLRKVGR